jgi:hypothetical protein
VHSPSERQGAPTLLPARFQPTRWGSEREVERVGREFVCVCVCVCGGGRALRSSPSVLFLLHEPAVREGHVGGGEPQERGGNEPGVECC